MAASNKATRWLSSNKNLAGTTLALVGPALVIAGVVAPPLGLIMIPALYAAGALAMPERSRPSLMGSLDPDDVARSVRIIRSSVKGKVHKSVLIRVNNICNLIEQVLPRANQLGGGSEEMHLLSRMATDYLPNALEPYLAMPREYAEGTPLSDGRTAIQILCSQLDVMYAEMRQVVDAVLQSDGDKLLANGRFLEDKFGQHPLNIPPNSQQYAAGQEPPPLPPLSHQILQAASQHVAQKMRDRKKQK